MGHNQTEVLDAEVVETKWKKTASPVVQDLYGLMLNKQRDIQSFHIWLHLFKDNLMPSIRDVTVHYHTISSIHDDYNLIRISLRANTDAACERKTQFHVFAYSPSSLSSQQPSSSSPCKTSGESTQKETENIPWKSFLQDVKYQHQIMYSKGELSGDYDCFVTYKQYARLYTLRFSGYPNIKECWVNFSVERMRTFSIQPLWQDSNDQGPLFEFKTHFTLITHLLRAFAWNISIPYVFRPPN